MSASLSCSGHQSPMSKHVVNRHSSDEKDIYDNREKNVGCGSKVASVDPWHGSVLGGERRRRVRGDIAYRAINQERTRRGQRSQGAVTESVANNHGE